MCIFMFFITFGKFFAILSSSILSAPFFLPFSSGTDIRHMLGCLAVSHRSVRLFLFFFNLFPFQSSDWII